MNKNFAKYGFLQMYFSFFSSTLISKKNFHCLLLNFEKKCICKSGKRQNVKNVVCKLQNITALKISFWFSFFVSFYKYFF